MSQTKKSQQERGATDQHDCIMDQLATTHDQALEASEKYENIRHRVWAILGRPPGMSGAAPVIGVSGLGLIMLGVAVIFLKDIFALIGFVVLAVLTYGVVLHWTDRKSFIAKHKADLKRHLNAHL